MTKNENGKKRKKNRRNSRRTKSSDASLYTLCTTALAMFIIITIPLKRSLFLSSPFRTLYLSTRPNVVVFSSPKPKYFANLSRLSTFLSFVLSLVPLPTSFLLSPQKFASQLVSLSLSLSCLRRIEHTCISVLLILLGSDLNFGNPHIVVSRNPILRCFCSRSVFSFSPSDYIIISKNTSGRGKNLRFYNIFFFFRSRLSKSNVLVHD